MLKQPKLRTASPALLLAVLFIVIGLLGLRLALKLPVHTPQVKPSPSLQVIEGSGKSPNDRPAQAGQALQGAADTNDFIQSRRGESLQPGSSLDQYLKDTSIR